MPLFDLDVNMRSPYGQMRKTARHSNEYLKDENSEGGPTESQLFQTAARMAIYTSRHKKVTPDLRSAYRDVIFFLLSKKDGSLSPTESLLMELAHAEEMGWGYKEIEDDCENICTESFSYYLEAAMQLLEPEKLAQLKQQRAERMKQDEIDAMYDCLEYL